MSPTLTSVQEEKEKTMKMIDGDKLYRDATRLWNETDSEDFEKQIFDLIKFSPSIDVVSVVRCEDCRKSHIDGKTTHYLWCTEWGRSTDTFGYCERGERRDDE